MRRSKGIQFEDVDYTLATITAGTTKGISFSQESGEPLPPREFNIALIAASLSAGGHEDTLAFAQDLPIFVESAFGKFLNAAMEVNGLNKTGEAKAEASPAAESTGESFTED